MDEVQADGAAEDISFSRSRPLRIMIVDGIAVRHANDFLIDDRTFVEIHGDVVTRRSDQLYTSKECLMVGLCARRRPEETNDGY